MFGDLESWIFKKGQTEICSALTKLVSSMLNHLESYFIFQDLFFCIFLIFWGEGRKEEDRITVNKNSSLLAKLNINSILFDLTQRLVYEKAVYLQCPSRTSWKT